MGLMSRQDETLATGRLAGEALSGVVGVVRDIHAAIDARVEQHLPATARPVVAAQRGITAAVYAAVAAGHRVASRGAAAAVDAVSPAHAPAPSSTAWGRVAVPAVNGLWGDHVAANHPALAVPMAVRVAGDDVPVEPAALAAAFPAATSRIVVFVHGLAESDQAWLLRLHDASGDDALPYGQRLQSDLGLTPVYVRYNTGLHVSDNGSALAALLDDLVAAWPVPVDEVSLVGHSMGGLVGRSACHDAEQANRAWVAHVRTVVTLGTPHLGAPLEQAVHVTEWLLRRLPETAPLTRFVSTRSVGTRDLGHGRVVEADWHGHDPDAFLRDTCTDVPFLSHATYCFVAGSVTRDLQHPLGRLLGDGLVRYPSAAGVGTTRRTPLPMHTGAHLPAVHHLALLHHPSVYALLREWLASADSAPGGDRRATG
jgi:pimeloyl-ACP methyl ester carboxylesterase